MAYECSPVREALASPELEYDPNPGRVSPHGRSARRGARWSHNLALYGSLLLVMTSLFVIF